MTIMEKLITTIFIYLLWAFTCQAQLPADNVVAYFPFNGDATDVSGNDNTPSNSNIIAVTLNPDRLGKLNSAYSFNGSSSIIKLPNQLLPSSTAFAISCWVKIAGIHATSDQFQTIIDLRGQYGIALFYYQSNYTTNPNTFEFYISSGPSDIRVTTPNNTAVVNTWQHLVATYGNNSMELYVDGTFIGAQTVNPPEVVTGYNNTIGKDYNVNINRCWVNGNIDEVIFYKRKLSASEVLSLYNRQKIDSEIPELYGPVSFSYDLAGKRILRNATILLKNSKYTHEPDSLYALNGENNQASQFGKDSFKYTDLEQKVKIYPNPTKGLLKTELSGFDPSLKIGIYVYNSTGQLLQQKVPATTLETIDFSVYPNGLYIMRIMAGDKVSEWKIIKE
jgi:hypothetical protein